MIKSILSFFLICGFIGSSSVAAEDSSLKISLPVTRFQLKNGLTVLLLEDHSVPMVSYHTWYRVGSRYEALGTTGAAHMLEHMMFKGAKKFSGKDFDRILHENGIVNNAFTTYDYTGFYENLPSSKLDLMMDLEVDRMNSLNLLPEDLKSEREVVKEERRWRVDNNPMGLLNETVMATVFNNHPYRWPVIGYMKDIENYNVDKLRFFYETYYIPNNAVLVLVGDFKTADVKSMIEKHYGELAYRPLPNKTNVSEPSQDAPRSAVVRRDVQNNSFVVAFRSPAQGKDDMFALDLASNILGNGSSSRLHRRLVYQKQLATSVFAYNLSMQEEGVFMVGVNLKPGVAMKEALEIINSEVAKMRTQKISDAELAKVKTQIMKEHVDGLQTMDGKARALAVNEIVTGSYESLFKDLDRYEKISADDIKKAMEKYTVANQRVVVSLEPKVAKITAPAAAKPADAADANKKTAPAEGQ